MELRATAGRCVGRLLLTAGSAGGPGGPAAPSFGAAHVNITAGDPPVILTNVAGRAWPQVQQPSDDGTAPTPSTSGLPPPGEYTDWAASVYMPFAHERGGRCTFTLIARRIAAIAVPAGSGGVLVRVQASYLETVVTWPAGIAAPTRIAIALEPAATGGRSDSCDLTLRLRGPANFMGGPASWDGNVSLSAASPTFTTPAGMLGFAGGDWALELRPSPTGCGPSATVRIVRVPNLVLPVPAAAVHIRGGSSTQRLFALPHRSPPFSYAGVSVRARAGAGICEGVTLAWLGDTFSAPGTATSTSFRPFRGHVSAPPHPTRTVCYHLRGAHADRVRIGAWDPMS